MNKLLKSLVFCLTALNLMGVASIAGYGVEEPPADRTISFEKIKDR